MEKVKHYDGPWFADDEHRPNHETYQIHNGKMIIAHSVSRGNMPIVRAAPKLLEALKELYFSIYGGNSVSVDDAMNRAIKTDELEMKIVRTIREAETI